VDEVRGSRRLTRTESGDATTNGRRFRRQLSIVLALGCAGLALAGAPAMAAALNPPTLDMLVSPSQINLNDSTTVTVTVTNPNPAPGPDLTGIGFSMTLPAGLAFPPAGPNTGCSGTVFENSTALWLSGAQLSPGTSCIVSASITATSSGVKNLVTTGAVSAQTSDAGSPASGSITVISPTAVVPSPSPPPPPPGSASAVPGERAAALKKCMKKFKKNHSKQKFKQCKKKADLLPA
jgi:hypothetical protein